MTSFADPGAVHRAIDALAAAFARRRSTVDDPTPSELRAARQYVQGLLDAGWAPPTFTPPEAGDATH